MNMKELLKSLVETDDKMLRMQLVEENSDILADEESVEDVPNDKDVIIETLTAELDTLKQKYIDTFFNTASEEEPEEEPVEKDVEDEEPPTLDELFKDGE